MNIPFVDLSTEYQEIKSTVLSEIDKICLKSSFILGEHVSQFEKEFAKYLNAKYCVGVASGTDALILAFDALNLNPGDEVLVPANTFVGTIVGILRAGLKPVLIDIDEKTYLMDNNLLAAAITNKTKAICVVHLYGRACNMSEISDFAKKYSLYIIEDAAQAHGAKWQDQYVGTIGDIGCFSFYPAKNLGCYGDGGAIVTNNEDFAKRIARRRNYGSEKKYEYPENGINSRLDSIQAAILSIKLKSLSINNQKRWEAAQRYNILLDSHNPNSLILPDLTNAFSHVFHLYVVQVKNRAAIINFLSANGVPSGIHYPYPFYLQTGYSNLGYKKKDFPITEKISETILSLPFFPGIEKLQQEYVANTLIKALSVEF